MDWLIPVRPGDGNDELRYALRSIQTNAPWVTRLVTVGYCPTWLQPDLHIEGNRFGDDKPRNVYDNIQIVCSHPDVAVDAIIGNDDFYILQPIDSMPMLHRGTLADHLALDRCKRDDWWPKSLRATQAWLLERGHTDPLSYELHVPFPVNARRMAQVLDEAADCQPENPPQWRTLYGAYWQVPSAKLERDVKFYRNHTSRPTASTFASTTDAGFQASPAGRFIRATFTKPSRWER